MLKLQGSKYEFYLEHLPGSHHLMKWDSIITIKLVKMKFGVESYKLLSLGKPRLHVLNACSQHFKNSEKEFL